jgi:hypothetical protein
MNRKNLGLGMGKGYYNLAPMDSHIHSLSAKGIEWYTDKQGHIKGKRYRVVLLPESLSRLGVGKPDEMYFRTKKSADKYIKLLKLDKKQQIYTKGIYAKSTMSPEVAEVLEMKNDLAQEFFKTNYKHLSDAQKEEVNEAYREMTFKLSAKEIRELQRKGFNISLGFKVKGLPIKANVKIDQLNPEDLVGVPDIVMKDKAGSKLRWESIDNATGNIIGKGREEGQSSYKRVLMNEKDQIIPSSEVEYYEKDKDGKLRKVQQYESNIGGNKEVMIEKVLPKEEEENYLVESTYQLVGQKESDDEGLYAIAKELYDTGKMGVISVVFRSGFKKQYGLVVPTLYKDKFSVIVRMTRAKVEPIELPIPTKSKAMKKEKLPTIKVKELFAKKRKRMQSAAGMWTEIYG